MHRVAVVGAGRIGRLHAANLARVPGLELVAMADPVPGEGVTRRRLARACSTAPTSTPSSSARRAPSTPEQVAAFAEAGKHVFCEKPIATDLASADRAVAAAEAAGIVLQVGYNRRFDRNFAAVRAAVASGRVGRPLIVRITARDPEPPLAGLPRGPRPGDDVRRHDLARPRPRPLRDRRGHRRGERPRRRAARHGATGMVDTAVTTAVTASGTLATIDNTWRAAYGYDQRLEVHGTDGTAQAGNERRDTTTFADGAGFHAPPPPYFFLDRYAESFVTRAGVVRGRARRRAGRGHRPRRPRRAGRGAGGGAVGGGVADRPARRARSSLRTMTALPDRPNTALLVVDVQNGVMAGAHNRDAVSRHRQPRRQGARRGRVGGLGAALERRDAARQRGWQRVPELERRDSEPVVHKTYADSFEGTDLESRARRARRRPPRRRGRPDRRVHPLDAPRRLRPRLRRDARRRRPHDRGPDRVGRPAARAGDRAHEPVLAVGQRARPPRRDRRISRCQLLVERPRHARAPSGGGQPRRPAP